MVVRVAVAAVCTHQAMVVNTYLVAVMYVPKLILDEYYLNPFKKR